MSCFENSALILFRVLCFDVNKSAFCRHFMSKVRRRFQFGMGSLVLLMTVACVGVGIYQTWDPEVNVLIAKDNLDFRTEISKANVRFERWPARIVPEGAITSAEGIPKGKYIMTCLLYTSPSPRDRQKSRMPSSA